VLQGSHPYACIRAPLLTPLSPPPLPLSPPPLPLPQIAKRQAVVNPENTFFSVKRFIGRRMNEVTEECKQVPYVVSGGPGGWGGGGCVFGV
jgi:hypothetical protein